MYFLDIVEDKKTEFSLVRRNKKQKKFRGVFVENRHMDAYFLRGFTIFTGGYIAYSQFGYHACRRAAIWRFGSDGI